MAHLRLLLRYSFAQVKACFDGSVVPVPQGNAAATCDPAPFNQQGAAFRSGPAQWLCHQTQCYSAVVQVSVLLSMCLHESVPDMSFQLLQPGLCLSTGRPCSRCVGHHRVEWLCLLLRSTSAGEPHDASQGAALPKLICVTAHRSSPSHYTSRPTLSLSATSRAIRRCGWTMSSTAHPF